MAKKEPLSVYLPKLILMVSMLVSFGALAGAIGYLIVHSDINIGLPIINDVTVFTDKEEYELGESISIKIVNNSDKSIYLPGCNSFTKEKKVDDRWVGLWGVECFAEGNSRKINARNGEDFSSYASGKGLYRIRVDYYKNCAVDNVPISRSNCDDVIKIYSNGFTIKEKPAEEAIDFYSCAQDSDCVSVKNDCCGCTSGGTATAINKNLKDQWKNNCNAIEPIACPAVMSNDPSCIGKIPKCENKKCVLASVTASLDMCDIGSGNQKSGIFNESNPNLNNFKKECIKRNGCFWKDLGGKIESHYACCPLNQDSYVSGNSVGQRCGIIID